MQFKAAMFDFDGTITEEGKYSPSQKMADALVELTQKIPIAFCTGRQLESFVERGLNALLSEIKPNYRELFLKNLHLIAENGSMGYDYDVGKHQFEKFYEVAWPENFVKKEDLKRALAEAIKDYGSVYDDAHKVVVVMRTKLHHDEGRTVEEVAFLSGEIYKITLSILQSLSENFENHLHVGDSGIGVIVCPADGDKDRGVREFANFLRRDYGYRIDENAREILLVGDHPSKQGNDFYFLSGSLGTPYTVGKQSFERFPKSVIGKNGEKLLHDQGSLYLIKKLLEGGEI